MSKSFSTYMVKLYDSCQKYENRYISGWKVIVSLIKDLMRKAGSRAFQVPALAGERFEFDGTV